MEFKDYESKPIIRKAYELTDTDIMSLVFIRANCFSLDGTQFMAYESVSTGDYIVYLDDTDIYHCSQKVFKERNITKE